MKPRNKVETKTLLEIKRNYLEQVKKSKTLCDEVYQKNTVLGDVIIFLEGLKRKHHINDEDCWYSCPASGECCNDDLEECNCGADDVNEEINKQIHILKDYYETN